MLNLQLQPVKVLSWKRRSGRGPNEEKKAKGNLDEDKLPTDYIFQSSNLNDCLDRFSVETEKVDKHIFLKIFLFPDETEVDERLQEYFEQRYQLEFIDVESYGLHSLAFFEVKEREVFIALMREDIAKFAHYASSGSDSVELDDRRITLIKSFDFLSSRTVDQIAYQPTNPVDSFSFALQSVRPETLPKEYIQSCADAFGLQVSISQNGSDILETDILEEMNEDKINPITLRSFLNKLKDVPGIRRIYLNKTVIVEHAGFSAQIKKEQLVIEKPLDTSPIIAIIDSGVENNRFTENSFIEGEGGLSLDNTNINPQTDKFGHGTEVASIILFGHTLESDIIPERKSLLPVSRIYPIKLKVTDLEKGLLEVDWKQLFDKQGDLAKAIRKLGIKVINLSVNGSSHTLNFPDQDMSVLGALIDSFAKELRVIIVNSAGNISIEDLKRFIDLAGKSGFENINNEDDYGFFLRALPPADFLSGISVGSCWKTDDRDVAVPSWFSRCLPAVSMKSPSKPDCLAIGGDLSLKILNQPPSVSLTMSKAVITARSSGEHVVTDDHLYANIGTSLSAPQVTRTLALISSSYPEIEVETIKGLFLHRAAIAHARKTKMTDDIEPQSVKLHECFRGTSLFAEKDEPAFISGQTNSDVHGDITYAIEGVVTHEKVLSYDIPLSEFREYMSNRKDHQIRLRLSICYFPSLPSKHDFTRPIAFMEANQVHIAGCLHSPAVEPVYLLEKTDKNGRKSSSVNTLTTTTEEWLNFGILNWTLDYYKVVQTPFSTVKTKWLTLDDLEKKIAGHDSIRLSVRCHIRDSDQLSDEQRFSAIVSLEDLGAYAKAGAAVSLEAEVEVE